MWIKLIKNELEKIGHNDNDTCVCDEDPMGIYLEEKEFERGVFIYT